MGGKPSKGTKKDRRLSENKSPKKSKPAGKRVK